MAHESDSKDRVCQGSKPMAPLFCRLDHSLTVVGERSRGIEGFSFFRLWRSYPVCTVSFNARTRAAFPETGAKAFSEPGRSRLRRLSELAACCR